MRHKHLINDSCIFSNPFFPPVNLKKKAFEGLHAVDFSIHFVPEMKDGKMCQTEMEICFSLPPAKKFTPLALEK